MKRLFNQILILFYFYSSIANSCTLIKTKKTKAMIAKLKQQSPKYSGSFGKVWIINDVAYKMIEVKSSLENQLTKKEIEIMDSLRGEYDLVSIKEDACLYDTPQKTMMQSLFNETPTGNDNYYIQMDYMKDGTLKTFLNNEWKNFNFFEKFDLMYKLAVSVKKLHNKGFKHLDIKPENFFMLNKYTPVLGDFGFSTTIDDVYRGFTAGTPNFIAPEIFNFKNYYCSSDVYALGITFYQMINLLSLPKKGKKHEMMKINPNGIGTTQKIYSYIYFGLVRKMTLKTVPEETNYLREIRLTMDQVLEQMLEILPELFKYEKKENPQEIKIIIDNQFSSELELLTKSDYSVTQRLVREGDIIRKLYERRNIYYKALGIEIEEVVEEEDFDLGEQILLNEGVPQFKFDDGDELSNEVLTRNENLFQNIDFSKVRNSVLVVRTDRSFIEFDNLEENGRTGLKSVVEQNKEISNVIKII